MTIMRERLIELVRDACAKWYQEAFERTTEKSSSTYVADHLLANGVIVPPCNVGQTIYFLGGIRGKSIKSATVEEIIINDNGVRDLLVTTENGVTFEDSIETFYLTREEAERALKGEKVLCL